MGRRRSQDKHLPALVSFERHTYYFRRGKEPRVNLGRDFADAMRRYGELLGPSPLSKLAEVIDRYQREITPRKGERTQEDELGYLGKLRSVFGGMAPRDITPVMIAELRDKLAAKHGAVQANHHLKTLKHLLKIATEWGAISHNPAREVSKLKVKPRERYVTDEELAAVRAKAPPMVQVAIDLAVLNRSPPRRSALADKGPSEG